MNNPTLRSIIIEPKEKANAAIICLHGLGADGNDLVDVMNEIKFQSGWNVRIILPHAPRIPVTINQKQVMPAWYDIKSINTEHTVEKKSVDISHSLLLPFLESLIGEGIKSERIFLSGFSQGASMALEVGLHFPRKLAGIIMMSGYVLSPKKIQMNRIPNNNLSTPIFCSHGTLDQVVPISFAKRSLKILMDEKLNVTWKEYGNMGHQISIRLIKDISNWIRENTS